VCAFIYVCTNEEEVVEEAVEEVVEEVVEEAGIGAFVAATLLVCGSMRCRHVVGVWKRACVCV